MYTISMPSRNTRRQDAAESFHHIYARGICKANIFHDSNDKDYFLYLLSRHLSITPTVNKQGYIYPHFREQVELLAYCLMDNHFHMLFYQARQGVLSELMQSILSAYTAYSNRKYKRTGPLFESRFKAALINNGTYLMHISRYIHLNPRSWKRYQYSSLLHIRKANEPAWLQTSKILALFKNRKEYLVFVADYQAHKQALEDIKYELANL
jgi:putative transposase